LIACIKNKNIDCLISYTIKPNVYSGIALFFCKKIKFVPVVTGLGFAFQEGSFVRRLLKNITVWLHRISFRKAHKVIVQNTHNTQFLIEQNIVEKENVILIEGDGVNIPDISEKKFGAKLRFVSLARLLGEKGLRELRDAIYEVKKTYPDFHVELFGPIENSADAISVAEIDAWKREGTLLWKGYCENIDKLFRESDIFTLPSYHEGMSTAVSEAIAYGLPVVGSDIPGIKEMVDRNGYLVAPRKVRPLADALKRMLEASLEDLKYMSMRSRQIAIYKFDRVKIMNEIEKVIA
jgi:glycosyltransferase involved in cell wall biosynthesis